jgi:D-threo-aldose 1-dehydrogenase
MTPPQAMALPPIGLGCATFGATSRGIGESAAVAVILAAWESGIRLFDTAALYGGGLSERRLGLALGEMPRAQWGLSTKLGRYRAEGDLPPSQGGAGDSFDFSAERTMRAIGESLERLRTDRLDIVHLHDCDAHLAAARAEALPVLRRLQEQGVIGLIGVGCNAVAPIMALVQEGAVGAALIAGRYTLLDASAAERLLPLCARTGTRVLVGGVFNSGVLAASAPEGATYDYAPLSPAISSRVARLSALCLRWRVSRLAAALQFPGRHQGVDTVLVGVDDAAQLRANLEALSLPIPEEFWLELAQGG